MCLETPEDVSDGWRLRTKPYSKKNEKNLSRKIFFPVVCGSIYFGDFDLE